MPLPFELASDNDHEVSLRSPDSRVEVEHRIYHTYTPNGSEELKEYHAVESL